MSRERLDSEEREPTARLKRLEAFHPDAVFEFLQRLEASVLPFERRRHEPARHARHLAALWDVPLPQAGRATLFSADGRAVLALVPADRKISAPRFRQLLEVTELRVLRADRGVGRLGWRNLAGAAGVLPAIPALYEAEAYVEDLVLAQPQLIVALSPEESVRLSPGAYIALTNARTAQFAGRTRLLPEGGMVREPAEPTEQVE